MSAEPGPNRMAAVEELPLLRQRMVDLVLSGSLIIALSFASGCRVREEMPQASIEFTRVPQAGEDGSEAVTRIEGRVRGARPEERIVLFEKGGSWWIQPLPMPLSLQFARIPRGVTEVEPCMANPIEPRRATRRACPTSSVGSRL